MILAWQPRMNCLELDFIAVLGNMAAPGSSAIPVRLMQVDTGFLLSVNYFFGYG